ncbi:MAG: 50S ribosomal protein L30 [Syntrophales bacterium]
MGKMLKVTQVQSYIGRPEKQRKVLRGLGLGKMHKSVILQDTPEVRGMIKKIEHLVASVEVKGNE